MPQATATILGAGSIGMAISTVLSENKYKVLLWDIEQEVVDSINLTHKNPRSMPEVSLDKFIKATSDMKRAVMNADIVVFAVPSFVVREVAEKISSSIQRNCVIVSLSKGLEKETYKTMEHVIREEIGNQFENQICVISGPMLAHDMILKHPTSAMLASKKSNAYSKRAMDAFANEWFRISETRDVMGVSIGGVSKHAFAVMAGILSGAGYSSNTAGWILSELFREMSRLIWKLGGSEETAYSVACLGDALGTAFSKTSRNRQFGELIGKGKTVTRALQSVKETVEGPSAIEALYKMAEKERLNLPILRALMEILCNKKKCENILKDLLKEL